jgi:hypothetical protein
VAAGDFAFVITGGTGEGDASQLVWTDELITAEDLPDVRFVVVS